MRTREEHLAWAKQRALEYLWRGELADAVASMGSDMGKHPELRMNDGLMAVAMLYVINYDVDGVKRWIEGFR
jgi:hypothetical protein